MQLGSSLVLIAGAAEPIVVDACPLTSALPACYDCALSLSVGPYLLNSVAALQDINTVSGH